MGLGEAGVINATPQRLIDGKWLRAPDARSATRWRARAYYRGWDGLRYEMTRFGRTKREAERLTTEALDLALKGGDASYTAVSKFVDCGAIWLERIARSGLSERSVKDYGYCWSRYVDAEGSSLRGLTLTQANDPQRLRAFLQRVADKHGNGATKTSKTVLSSVLNMAVEDGVLTANATLQLRAIKSAKPKRSSRNHEQAFTKSERNAILELAYARCEGELHPRTWRKRRATADLVALMAGTGCRIEEARSLRWEDLMLETQRLRIPGTKTERAERVVGVPEWLCERLRERAGLVDPSGYVVGSPALLGPATTPWEQSNSASAVRELLDLAGFPWAIPHTFRRTVVSLLHEQGVPLVKIADQVGHMDPSMTAWKYLGRNWQGRNVEDLAALL